ncbi:MAG: Uma2 family endonuclease [Bacteroidota bacterium]|nr:Uma2 family endonuclease [Bacteroidota bacterium]
MAVITKLSDLDLDKTYSYADYLMWQFQERVELIKGKIFEMSPAPSRKHQVISRILNRYLDRYFEYHSCGLYCAPFDVRLVNFKKSFDDKKIFSVVQPDLCVVCDKEKLDDRGCIGAPDLVVEILSPGNSKKEMGIKFDLYEENGVKEYWIVEPAENCIFVYTLKDGKYIGLKPCIEGQKITSPLFPALDFEIEKIFVDF